MITRTLCSDLCSPRICDQRKSFRGNQVIMFAGLMLLMEQIPRNLDKQAAAESP